MSIVLLESFEAGSDLGTKWDFGNRHATFRTGSFSRDIRAASTVWAVQASQQHDTYIFGFALAITNYATAAANYLMDIMDTGGSIIGHLVLETQAASAGARLRYQRAKDNVYLITTPFGIIDQLGPSSGGSWYYVELKVKCHASTGTVEIKTNEVSRASATAQDTTAASGIANIGSFQLQPTNQISGAMDDFYACNGAGAAPTNDFLGDTTIHKLLPNGNGDTNLWTGSDGNSADNYLLVDENTPSATDYVESGTILFTDLYNFQNLPAGVSGRQVFGLEHWSFAKTTALPNTMALLTKNGLLEVEGPTETMTVTDTWYVHRQETKPGGGAWTTADVDSAQHGQRVKS